MQRHFVRRTIALLTALILAFCLVFSSAYFGVNADHECLSSEDCPICTEMSLCSELTHALGSAAPSQDHKLTFHGKANKSWRTFCARL